MFSGTVSRRSEKKVASAATIRAEADILVVTGSVAIVNILPVNGGLGAQAVTIIPLAALTCTAAGNIAVAVTFVVNRAQVLTWSQIQKKWYPSIAAV